MKDKEYYFLRKKNLDIISRLNYSFERVSFGSKSVMKMRFFSSLVDLQGYYMAHLANRVEMFARASQVWLFQSKLKLQRKVSGTILNHHLILITQKIFLMTFQTKRRFKKSMDLEVFVLFLRNIYPVCKFSSDQKQEMCFNIN